MSPIFRYGAPALLLIIFAAPLHAQEPTGGPLARLVGRLRSHRCAPAPAAAHTPCSAPRAASPQAAASDCSGGDPYGFTTIVNRLRARAGLCPVAYDPELSSWASQNNSEQCRRGLGHHVNPCCFQNCGWNYADASSVAQGWMDSPGHRQNLLAPQVQRFGIAYGPGPYWTFNAR